MDAGSPSHRAMAERPAAGPKSHTIVVVDDEQDVLFSLAALFHSEVPGAMVLTADCGVDMVRLLEHVVPDLVLSDFRLPDMNGLEVLAAARQRAPDVTRVLMAAAPDQERVHRAIRDGTVDGFVPKPWDAEQLVASVRTLLDERAAMQEAPEEQQLQGVHRWAGGWNGLERAGSR